MTRLRPLHCATIALLALLPMLPSGVVGQSVSAKTEADQVLSDLNQCTADPSKVQAVFKERFPHERCSLGQDCEANLVQTIEVLALERCRVAAIDTCFEMQDARQCVNMLSNKWLAATQGRSAELQARWKQLDKEAVSPFAKRRFGTPETFEIKETCFDLDAFVTALNVTEDALCQLATGFAEVTRMESLDQYLTEIERGQ